MAKISLYQPPPRSESPIVRVVYIDATSRTVSQVEVEPSNSQLSRLCRTSSRLKVVVTLPNGDLLLSPEGSPSVAGFSIGGSPTLRSNAVLLGKRDRWRRYTPPRSGADRVATLIRWVEANPAEAVPSELVWAILIEPTQRTIERVSIQRSLAEVEKLVGEKIVLAFRDLRRAKPQRVPDRTRGRQAIAAEILS